MKPFVRITALALGCLFFAGAAVAWVDFFKHARAIGDVELKQAAGWSLTSAMFLALGLRGRR